MNNQLNLEEFKDLGLEYRYRDQLMVQELGLAMVALGIVVNALFGKEATWAYFAVQIVIGAFLTVLYLHLRNIQMDRTLALGRREVLREALGFEKSHVWGLRRSGLKAVLWFVSFLNACWAVWAILTLCRLIRHL